MTAREVELRQDNDRLLKQAEEMQVRLGKQQDELVALQEQIERLTKAPSGVGSSIYKARRIRGVAGGALSVWRMRWRW